MSWLARQIRWIMMIAGVLTCSMALALFAPQTALQSFFGSGLDGPIAEIVVRNWGALIALGGVLLIYGAFVEPARRIALGMAAASKTVFIALVLIYGRDFLGYQAGGAVVADGVCVLVFCAYLFGSPRAER